MRPPVIIGGGPAGIAAAISLRSAGLAARVIERHAEPTDRLCGDFLGASAITIARSLGLAPETLGARPIQGLRVARRDRVYAAGLPFPASSLSRCRLDEALRARCHDLGVELVLGAQARPPRRDRDDFLVETDAGQHWVTGTVFLATGRQPHSTSVRTGWAIGWKHTLRLTDANYAGLGAAVEVTLLAGMRVALSPIENGEASLCVLSRDPDTPLTWPAMRETLIAASPRLRRLLAGATPTRGASLWSRDLAFAPPVRPRVGDHDGLYLLGDQAGLAAGLMADGVSAALRGGARAARAAVTGEGAARYHNSLRAMLWPRTRCDVTFAPPGRARENANKAVPDSIQAEWVRLIA